MFACSNGHEQCARALIEAKANVKTTQNQGFTALMFSCQNGHERCALELIKAGADVNINRLGFGPPMLALLDDAARQRHTCRECEGAKRQKVRQVM
jgi:ankyrin repeat protein